MPYVHEQESKRRKNKRIRLICTRTKIRSPTLRAPSDCTVHNQIRGAEFLEKELRSTEAIPGIFRGPNAHNRVHKRSQLLHVLMQNKPVHVLQSYFFRSILISTSHVHIFLTINLTPNGYLSQPCTHFSAPLCKQNSPPNSTFLI